MGQNINMMTGIMTRVSSQNDLSILSKNVNESSICSASILDNFELPWGVFDNQ